MYVSKNKFRLPKKYKRKQKINFGKKTLKEKKRRSIHQTQKY